MKCCNNKNQDKALLKPEKKQGFWMGLVYGLVPHIGCIAFIVFTVLGVTAATSLFKPLLMNRYFFHILVVLSIVFATISAFFYFKKQGFITFSKSKGGLGINFLQSGIKRKWKYLLTLYGTTVGINLILFMVIFPVVANLNSGSTLTAAIMSVLGKGEELELSESNALITLKVDIPCPGHAPLIMGELKTIDGTENVQFRSPNIFDVIYNPEKTSKEQLLSLDVFNSYKPTVISEKAGGDVKLVEDDGNAGLLIDSSCANGCGGGCGGSSGCGCGGY